MLPKVIAIVAILAVSNANPIWLGHPYMSGAFFRNSPTPSIAFGFGSGFSSDFGGIKYSNSFGNSFQTGDGQAYGAGFGSTDGNTLARGQGYARIVPQQTFQPFYRYQSPVGFQQASASSFNVNGKSFGTASAQSFGNFASASAQSVDGVGTAVSAVQNNGEAQTAISSVSGLGRHGSTVAATNDGHGFGTVISRADNLGGYQNAVASTQGRNSFLNNGQRGAFAQDFGGYRTSTAYNVQRHGDIVENNIASAINGPGFQLAQSQSVNNGYHRY